MAATYEYDIYMKLVRCGAVLLLVLQCPLIARQPVKATRTMIVTEEPNATDVGVAVLKAGGNAVDAAVAIAFSLAVTHPAAGNIGGGGFLLLRLADGRSSFIDFRERAPGRASRDMYVKQNTSGPNPRSNVVGPLAVAIPGTVRGLERAHSLYGTQPWARLVEPAIRLA